MGLAVFILPKKRPRFDQKLPTGTSEQSSEGRLAKMWTRIVSIEPTCASRVLNDLGTMLFPLKLSFREIDTKLELNPHTTPKNFIGEYCNQKWLLSYVNFFLLANFIGKIYIGE